jgi:rhodanese-related sulfurtransferase
LTTTTTLMADLIVNYCSERQFFNKVILGDFQLVDAQPSADFNKQHIIGAQNIILSSNDLEKEFATLQRTCYAERTVS